MKALKYTAVFLLAMIFSSCGNAIYEKHQDVREVLKWEMDDTKKFEMDIPDTKPYNVVFALRHHSALNRPSLPLKYQLTGPGLNEDQKIDFKMRDENGNILGSAAGDICDTEMTVLSNFSFPEAGKYTLVMSQASGDPIPGMIEIGVRVSPIEK